MVLSDTMSGAAWIIRSRSAVEIDRGYSRIGDRLSIQAGTKYRCEHYDGKARVADWMRSQPSDVGVDGMAWTIVTSGPYMDMLFNVRSVDEHVEGATSDSALF